VTPETQDFYPLTPVIRAVRREFDDDPVSASDLIDAFETPVNNPGRLEASLHELMRRGEVVEAESLSSYDEEDGYVPTDAI